MPGLQGDVSEFVCFLCHLQSCLQFFLYNPPKKDPIKKSKVKTEKTAQVKNTGCFFQRSVHHSSQISMRFDALFWHAHIYIQAEHYIYNKQTLQSLKRNHK